MSIEGGTAPSLMAEESQRGCRVTVMVKEGTLLAPAATGWKPESTPPDKGWHGAVNEDCVTVWFLG